MEHPNMDIVLGVNAPVPATEQERAEMHEACSSFNLKEHLDRLSAVASENAVGTAGPQVSPDVRIPFVPVEGGDFSGEQAQEENPIGKLHDGSEVYLDSFSDTANPDGVFSHLTLRFVGPNGDPSLRSYTADDLPKLAPPPVEPEPAAAVPEDATEPEPEQPAPEEQHAEG